MEKLFVFLDPGNEMCLRWIRWNALVNGMVVLSWFAIEGCLRSWFAPRQEQLFLEESPPQRILPDSFWMMVSAQYVWWGFAVALLLISSPHNT